MMNDVLELTTQDEAVEKLIRKRKDLHLSQFDMCDLTYMTQSAISNLERGRTAIKIENLCIYAKALGFDKIVINLKEA